MNKRCIPYGVNFELIARCNLDCRHCYHVQSTDKILETSEVKRVLDELAALGTLEVTFTGGEPLLRRDFIEIVRYAVETAGFSVKVFSNLTLLDEKTADVLAAFPLNSVETTILGPDAESHDALARVSGAFDKTIAAIRMLKVRGIRINAKTIAMKPNIKKLGKMFRLADTLGIPFRYDDSLFVESDGRRRPLALQVPDSMVRRLRKRTGGDRPYVPSVCNAARSIMSISPDGTVYPCGAFPVRVGSVRETPLKTIWYDAPIMKTLRAIRYDDYNVCKNCEYVLRCKGCMAIGMGLASGRTIRCRFERKKLKSITAETQRSGEKKSES